ncbi:MAG: 50S ribosomal protein L13 [Clostridia bacterium]|nr:50S ribosomal protein L13 [Clostridia bacterium]
MSTYMANPQNVERAWYVLDAAGKTLGEVAVEAAVLLRGKHKVTYTPHVDCGDYVVIVNASKVVLTGKKVDQKMYYHHTGYIGNMKKVKYSTLLKTKPVFVVEKAVKGMLPANALTRKALTRLHVYAGAEHAHTAQKLVAREF